MNKLFQFPTAQQTLSFFQRPTTVAFGGGVTLIALFYAILVGKEWHNNMNELQQQLNKSKQKWQAERLSLDAKVSHLELRLHRTELELAANLESLPKNDGQWSRSFIELKYDECTARKK